jgi:hypothetical protein
MVTKRVLGAKKGRPEKPKIEAPKRPKGRPAKPIATDPERYLKAFIQALIDHEDFMESQGLISDKASANKIAEMLIGLRYGRLPEGGRHIETKEGGKITAEENLLAMMNGKPFYVYAEPKNGCAIYRSKENGDRWRDGNTFRPTTHNVLKDLRLARNGPPDDPSRQWLAAMSMIWKDCFQSDISFSPVAERLADAIGEREYFQAVMKPVMIAHAALRDTGFQGEIPMAGWLAKICSPSKFDKLTS